MTRKKSFKTRVRARMAKTGERYTAARRQLVDRAIRRAEEPATAAPSPSAPPPVATAQAASARASTATQSTRISDQSVRARTGRGRDEWFALLDAWEATQRSHPQIARWLQEEHGVGGWWAQTITVAYEQERGLRVPGQVSGGEFAAGVSRTMEVPVERLSEAFTDAQLRERWLPNAPLQLRTVRPGTSLTADWDGGTSRLAVTFLAKGEAKSQVALQHLRLPNAETSETMKAFWREHLDTLKRLLTT